MSMNTQKKTEISAKKKKLRKKLGTKIALVSISVAKKNRYIEVIT